MPGYMEKPRPACKDEALFRDYRRPHPFPERRGGWKNDRSSKLVAIRGCAVDCNSWGCTITLDSNCSSLSNPPSGDINTADIDTCCAAFKTILLLREFQCSSTGANAGSGIFFYFQTSIFKGSRSACVFGENSGNRLSIKRTGIGFVSCLTALLQLGCEHRDCNCDEHGDDRHDDEQLGQGKAFAIVLPQWYSSFS